MMRCCFELTRVAASVGFMVLSLIYSYIHIIILFQFYIRKLLHTPPVNFLFRSPPGSPVFIEIYAKDMCNNNVIPNSSNKPLELQESKR